MSAWWLEADEFMAPGSQERHRVLVVDDEEDVRKIVSIVLEPSFDVFSAGDGLDGLFQVPIVEPDAVVADVMMPVLDGRWFVRRARRFPGNESLPVLLVSLFQNGAMPDMKGDNTVLLPKPFDPHEVLRHVARAVAGSPPRPKSRDASTARSLLSRRRGKELPFQHVTPGCATEVLPDVRPVPPLRVLAMGVAPDLQPALSLLEREGCEVLSVSNVTAALHVLPEFGAEIYLVDGAERELGGYRLADTLRGHGCCHPRLLAFVSRGDGVAERPLLERLGIDLALGRPISPPALAAELLRHAEDRRLSAAPRTFNVQDVARLAGLGG